MTNISISEIETHLYDKLKKLVSKNTYAGTFPDTIQASWNDMCLIDCSNAIKDFDAYGNGSVLIFLYARPRANGTKNVKVMSELESKFNNSIAELATDKFFFNIEYRFTDYDQTRQWHCVIIDLNIVIV